jgi:hypothetical protein
MFTKQLEVAPGRFSFDETGRPIDGPSGEATPAEMAAHFLRIDRAMVRRRSVEMDAPECRIDGNEASRIMLLAYAIDKKTRQHRTKYQHGGVLGDRAIELLRLLMNIGRKRGRIFYDYDSLAAMFGKHRETVMTLMKRLIREGFVTKHRRSKIITTAQGPRRVQNSNAYEVHLPRSGIGAASIVSLGTSESNNPVVSVSSTGTTPNDRLASGGAERFWLAEPYRMPDGTMY